MEAMGEGSTSKMSLVLRLMLGHHAQSVVF